MVYAGTLDGVFKSTDSGGTWAPARGGLPDQLHGGDVKALAVNPARSTTLYAGLNGGGVFRSTDAGTTWVAVLTSVIQANAGNAFSLAIDPSNTSTVYTGSYGAGVFRSTDSGDTWTAASAGLTNLEINTLFVNPTSPSTLEAGTDYGVFRSTDSGRNWIPADAGMTGVNAQALAVDPVTPATLYAGTSGRGVFKSTDSGRTWAPSNAGLTVPWFGGPFVRALAVDPSLPSTLYAGMQDSGVFRSTDSGGTWTGVSEGLPVLTNDGVRALAIDPKVPAILYGGTDGLGIFKSTDSGLTWTVPSTRLTGLPITTLAIDPGRPATLYAGTGAGLFKSTDSGITWADASTGLTSTFVNSIVLNPSAPSTLYVGTDGGVFKSTDSGGSWIDASVGLSSTMVMALTVNPANPATLYAGTWLDRFVFTRGGEAAPVPPGVYRSTDSGATWNAVNAGLPPDSVLALALDPTGATTLHASLNGGSVWQSTDPVATAILCPTSARSAGLGGAFYTTDLSITNLGAWAASLTLKFLGHDQDGSSGAERTYRYLLPGMSTTFEDVLGSVFNETTGFGAIRVTSDVPSLAVVSVTSTPGFGGTFGQTLPAVRSSDLIPAGTARSIPYVREGDGFRSNLVLASASATTTLVDVSLISPAGSLLGSRTYSIPPSGMTQVNRVVRDLGVSGPVTGARLVLFSATPGAAFTGLVSVIDETTNDPATMVAQPTPVLGTAPFTWLLPASAHASGLNGAFYTTNLAVANVGATPASFTLKFLGNGQDGSSGPERTFDLESGNSVTYFDVLGSVFGRTESFGAIRITSSSPSLDIASVTSTTGFGGTFGQTVPAVPSTDLIPATASRTILGIREGDGFRSNLVLASAAIASTRVDVTLVSAAGDTLATKSYDIPPAGMTQIGRVVRDLGVSGPITGGRLVLSSSTPGAAFTGFASVIDETTNDPIAVEAR